MSRKLEMYDRSQYTSYADALDAKAVRSVDVSEFDNSNSLSQCGVCTVMDAVKAAVKMIDGSADVVYMLRIDGRIEDIMT
ncbi:MAG: hypothetical protein CTY35_03560 [Methylotenera sp.]|nr:MAG: hypothetical protein CTY35_03560 [Methylotenera sp.]